MLPGADTKSGSDEFSAWRELGSISSTSRGRTERTSRAVVTNCCVLVNTLLTVDGFRVWSSGIVGGQDSVFGQGGSVSSGRCGALLCLDQPDETRAGHCVCGSQHCPPEGIDAAKRLDQSVFEKRVLVEAVGVKRGRQRIEEEMRVVSHTGGGEDGGHGGIARKRQNELLGCGVFVIGA